MKKIMMMLVAAVMSLNMMAGEPNNELQYKLVDRIDSTLVQNNVKRSFGFNSCYATLVFKFADNNEFKFDVYEKITKGNSTYFLGKAENNVNIIRVKNNIVYMPIGKHRTLVVFDKNFKSKYKRVLEPIEESNIRF